MRSNRLLYNFVAHLFLEVVTVISGLILPRMILSAFGSDYNGLITSITQFLSLVTLLRGGVGGVTRAALFKPLASNDTEAVSAIMNATQDFMRKIAIVFAGGLVCFACVFPLIVRSSFDWMFTFSMVIIIGIGTFIQYYFSISYQMLLIADQQQYVISIIQSVSTILNVLVAAVLIHAGFGIRTVKLGCTIVYCINPMAIVLYIKHHYYLDESVEPNKAALGQRWDAFAHQLASYVQENTDVIVLTFFSTIKEVSVYSVYFMISNGVKMLVSSLTAGIESAFGNMIAENDYDSLRRNMERTEFVVFAAATVVYGCLIVLVLPFVRIYTKDIVDVNYLRPVFAYILAIAQLMNCVRTPSLNVIQASGHFKQTRNGAIVEAVINVVVSVVCVIIFGLTGVAIGTLVSASFRTLQLSHYASSNILHRNPLVFYKRMMACMIELMLICATCWKLVNTEINGYFLWTIYALLAAGISCSVTLLGAVIVDRKILIDCIAKVWSIIMRK